MVEVETKCEELLEMELRKEAEKKKIYYLMQYFRLSTELQVQELLVGKSFKHFFPL